MTVQKRQRLMFVILIGSVLFALVMKPWERRRPAIAIQQPDVSEAVTPVTVASLALADIEYTSEWPARDPFKHPEEKQQPVMNASVMEEVSFGAPSFALQGIMTVGGEMVCVIDGTTHAVGSSASGWRVEKIEAQGVWVSQGGERHYVPLP